jgi:hypothetical protein
MGVWQGVALDSLKFHRGPPCPTPLRPAGGPPLKVGLWLSSTRLDTPCHTPMTCRLWVASMSLYHTGPIGCLRIYVLKLFLQGKAIKMGDKEVEYCSTFKLILHTKLANPHYKPEMQVYDGDD